MTLYVLCILSTGMGYAGLLAEPKAYTDQWHFLKMSIIHLNSVKTFNTIQILRLILTLRFCSFNKGTYLFIFRFQPGQARTNLGLFDSTHAYFETHRNILLLFVSLLMTSLVGQLLFFRHSYECLPPSSPLPSLFSPSSYHACCLADTPACFTPTASFF